MEGEFLFPVRAMNADPFLCACDGAVLFFSLVPGLSISEAIAAVGLQFVLLHFCRVLVMDHFYSGEVSRYGFQFKASETTFTEISNSQCR